MNQSMRAPLFHHPLLAQSASVILYRQYHRRVGHNNEFRNCEYIHTVKCDVELHDTYIHAGKYDVELHIE